MFNINFIIKSTLFICLFLADSFSQSMYTSPAEVLDSLLTSKTADSLPGWVVMVVQDKEIIFSKGFGAADNENKTRLDSQTPFYLASLSKQFTTMAIMILKEKNLLKYDDKISKYLPDLPPYAKNISVRNLMNHTSGLRDHYDVVGVEIKNLNNLDVWNILLEEDSLQFQPGEKYQYSNSAYVLLALIIEKISEKSYSQFLTENIFIPLRMKSTVVFDGTIDPIDNRAVGYSKDTLGNYYQNDYTLHTTGAGGIYSTLEDLYKWDQALYSEMLIAKNTLSEAFEKQTLNNGNKFDYGFGWMIGNLESLNNEKYVYHSGSLKGFRNQIMRIPGKNFTYIYLSNCGEHLIERNLIPSIFLGE
jgi:CubicO group peptidase (beta-lactamase class C family)